MEALETIITGVVASFVATLLWFVLSQAYSIKDRKVIDSKLEVAKTSLYEISQKIGYIDDYERVLQQIDRMFDALHDCVDSMKLLTYGYHFNRKKFIITIICNVIKSCEIAKNETIGLNGESEIEQRGKAIAELLGIDYTNCVIKESSQYNLIMMAQYLNGRCGVLSRLKNCVLCLKYKLRSVIGHFRKHKVLLDAAKYSQLSNDITKEELMQYLLSNETIDAKSFRTVGISGIDTVKDRAMTREEFENYVKKELR